MHIAALTLYVRLQILKIKSFSAYLLIAFLKNRFPKTGGHVDKIADLYQY